MKYFKVTCPAGHAGTKQSRDITFAIEAKNLIDAMDKARKFPMVKHDRLVANAKEITKEEYDEIRKESAYKNFENLRKMPKKRFY